MFPEQTNWKNVTCYLNIWKLWEKNMLVIRFAIEYLLPQFFHGITSIHLKNLVHLSICVESVVWSYADMKRIAHDEKLLGADFAFVCIRMFVCVCCNGCSQSVCPIYAFSQEITQLICTLKRMWMYECVFVCLLYVCRLSIWKLPTENPNESCLFSLVKTTVGFK